MAQAGTPKSENGQSSARFLPMVVTPQDSAQRSALKRPAAAFVAQLLAARDNLSIQRARRQASGSDASRAYHATQTSTVKRMPVGYRKSTDV